MDGKAWKNQIQGSRPDDLESDFKESDTGLEFDSMKTDSRPVYWQLIRVYELRLIANVT